jgi:hypothetical protein
VSISLGGEEDVLTPWIVPIVRVLPCISAACGQYAVSPACALAGTRTIAAYEYDEWQFSIGTRIALQMG